MILGGNREAIIDAYEYNLLEVVNTNLFGLRIGTRTESTLM